MSPKDWNALVAQNLAESGAFLQSYQWGEVEEACGRRIARVQVGGLVAQAVWVRLPFGRGYWYVARGVGARSGGIQALVGELNQQGRPDWVRWESFESSGLEGRSVDPLQCVATWTTDVSVGEETLLAGMHQKTRYNVRCAEKHGVVVHESDDISAFCTLMYETAKRDGFHGQGEKRYRAVLECLNGEAGGPKAHLLLASRAGVPLAGAVLVDWLGVRTYLYGASASAGREHMAPSALHAWALRDAHEGGLISYDWWGVSPSWHAKHPLDGVTRFKQGFPGERLETREMAIDCVRNPMVYRCYRVGSVLRGWLR